MNYDWTLSLFCAIIQKPMEKYIFEGTSFMLTADPPTYWRHSSPTLLAVLCNVDWPNHTLVGGVSVNRHSASLNLTLYMDFTWARCGLDLGQNYVAVWDDICKQSLNCLNLFKVLQKEWFIWKIGLGYWEWGLVSLMGFKCGKNCNIVAVYNSFASALLLLNPSPWTFN